MFHRWSAEVTGSVCAPTGSHRMHRSGTVGRSRAHSGRIGWDRCSSWRIGRRRPRMRVARSIAGHARRSTAPRVATRAPGLAPWPWRRERAPPAASGGHAAMAREVIRRRPLASPSCLCNRHARQSQYSTRLCVYRLKSGRKASWNSWSSLAQSVPRIGSAAARVSLSHGVN